MAKGYCYFISIKNANSFAELINEKGASTGWSGERWAGVGLHVFSIGDLPGLVHAVLTIRPKKPLGFVIRMAVPGLRQSLVSKRFQGGGARVVS
ncbi:hypothetical protein [Paraburkholderia sp. BCC1876]|uniref:hypothetical protein n=1 Tax=Paraburkholderia sp. BCC1876 TaxID=2676303 RepID=UPI00158FF8D7|nr:hypothetical protein [Paraburkholderia sp. BCC1876]